MKQHVVVVGGGLVGTAVARALVRTGAAVTVVERGVPGAEASWAAGGILSPQAECDADGPMLRLCLAGLEATLSLCAELGDVGLRKSGTLDVAVSDDEARALRSRVAWQRALGLNAAWLSPAEARATAPVGDVVGAAFFADEACLEPRKLFEQLRASAASSGVQFLTGRRVVSVDDDRVVLDEGAVEADAVVVAAGAWTPQVKGCGVKDGAVFPVRGQMVELGDVAAAAAVPTVYGCGGYAVFRGDGRVVVGSTMEPVGFKKQVTAGGLHKVLSTATQLLPSTTTAPVTSTWAGLRPATADGLPLLGRSTTGVWIASGHFRNGVLLAAVSAARIAAAIVDGASIDAAFAPSR
jgi:glycine oxidase